MVTQVKNKAPNAAPVLHMACQEPVAPRTGILPHLAHPRDRNVPWEAPTDVGLGVRWRTTPTSSHAAQGKPTPSQAVEKETVPFNDPLSL